ncbi:S-layer homology domain-containing protein [Brevibacillus parabrevis]|uniref:S-layer homology domain-containing protein n=1 Tax=Brevibacillus parabrevis TaxID=54914 RepID=UPI002380B07A|nr:S-layer homology domain-containing protein [Brevibacillus parabrevis]WDV92935.1 S-layer homology domain-containing protein [Brevibacillus parabrevis]
MKATRKLLAFSTFALLTLSMAQQGFAASAPFTDLQNVAAKNKIMALQQQGILRGVDDHRFMPDATITAAQGIQLIVSAFRLNIDNIRFIKEPKTTDYFAKADNDAWYSNVLIIAANNGLDLPADLEPEQIWTKEQFIHQLMLAMETHYDLPMIKIAPRDFADLEQLNPSYQGTIQRALVLGIAKLDDGQKMHPRDAITRQEAAEIIYNALEYVKAHPGPAESTPAK